MRIVIGSLAIVVLLSGCVTTEPGPVDFGAVPVWQVGDSWSYETEDRTYRTTSTVVGTDTVEGRSAYILETKVQDRADRYFTKAWVDVGTLAALREESRDLGFAVEGECLAVFPLENRSVVCRHQVNGRSQATSYNVVVGPEEQVEVPVGAFLAREISWWRTNATQPDHQFWYAPNVGSYVQKEMGDGRGLAKLTATTFGGTS